MNTTHNHLDSLFKRGTDLLGTQYAILGGAMTWVSDHNLVAAISNAGCFGVLASGSMPPELLREEIQKTRTLTQKPFGVNLITLNPQLEDLVDICIQESITHVVLAGGLPQKKTIETLKNEGIKVICFAPSLGLAKKLIRSNVDALVIEGHEAGGHIGPVATNVLAQEIIPHIDQVPIFVAGGIGTGESMLNYLEMGASGCQMGTVFVCAHECQAHPNFKKAFIKAQSRNAVVTPQLDPKFPVIPVRAIHNTGMAHFVEFQKEVIEQVKQEQLSQEEGQLKIEHYWAGALRKAVVEGEIETGSLMAGQSVGLVSSEESTQEIIDRFIKDAIKAIEKRAK